MRKPITVLSIDPGLTGGLALYTVTPKMYIYLDEVLKMPACVSSRYKTKKTNRIDVVSLHDLVEGKAIDYAFIEHIAARPVTGKDGNKTQGEASMFNFGYGTGLTEAVLYVEHIPFQRIYPVQWKTHFGLIKTPKAAATALAREYWPALKFSSGKADAALIGAYGIHHYWNNIQEVINGQDSLSNG